MTSPSGKVVQEQHYFSVRLSIHPLVLLSHYILLNYWAEFNQTCYMISPPDKGVQE